MKKLMLAVAIISTAVVGQAASIDWNAKTVKLVDDKGSVLTSLTSGSIMLVVLSDNAGWSEGTWSATKGSLTELASANIGSGSKSAGKISGNTYEFTYDETSGASPIKDNDVLAVVFKDSSGAYAQLKYVTTGDAVTDTMTVNGLASTGNTWSQTFNFGQAGGNIMTPSTSSIPEPTSAMLLMLGLCGLALKRKNA